MTCEEIFHAWAPGGIPWSNWVKPVLFAHIPASWATEWAAATPLAVEIARFDREGCAVVVDWPGETAVAAGLLLAHRGWRPVPLFNGAPYLSRSALDDSGRALTAMRSTIDVWPIVRELAAGARALGAMERVAAAPPAFLLDSRRRMGERSAAPGMFDNRWLSFPTDFPSAQFLASHGVRRVVVITADYALPAADLIHTLLRWQQGGIAVQQLAPLERAPRLIALRKPSMFRWVMYHFAQTMGMRRGWLGGFGGAVPHASAG